METGQRSGKAFEILVDPTFESLAEETLHTYLDWDQLLERPLPEGLSAAETWELLGRLRKLGGTRFPIPTVDGREFWYSLDREAAHCLGYIRRYCRADSPPHELLQEREGHRFLVHSRIRESIATCQLDGVVVDNARATRMLQEQRAPQTASDRIVCNSYEMLQELDQYAAEPFTPELVWRFYERVTRDVDLASVERGLRRTNLAGTRNPDEMRAEAENRGILQSICDYANGVTGDPDEPSVIKGYMIMSAMAYWNPLPDLNDTVARHMLRLFAVKRDYPVLGYLPTSLMMLRWFNHELAPGTVRFGEIERRPVVPDSIDGTRDILTHLQLTTAAISELIRYIRATRQQDERLKKALENAPGLNYRQRGVLAGALNQPEHEIRIRQHQSTHKVVYQTARTDLLELVDRGYLRKVVRGKAFVFVPVEDLQVRISGNGA